MNTSKTPKSERLGDYRALTGPAWRWTLGQEKTSGGNFAFLAEADEMTLLAARYQALANESQGGMEKAKRAFPLVANARTVHEDASRVNLLKIMVLGKCPVDTISQELGVDAEAVEAWESLFFDVRREPRSSSFVPNHVIHPEVRGGQGDLAAKFQLAAAGGPAAAWLLLKGESKAQLNCAAELIRKRMDLDFKVQKALSVDLKSERSSLKLIRMYADLVRQEGMLKRAEDRLGLRCLRAKQDHELALARTQAAQERAQLKATEEERKQRQKDFLKQTKLEQDIGIQQYLAERIKMERLAMEERSRNSPLALLHWHESAVPQSSMRQAKATGADSPKRPAAGSRQHAA